MRSGLVRGCLIVRLSVVMMIVLKFPTLVALCLHVWLFWMSSVNGLDVYCRLLIGMMLSRFDSTILFVAFLLRVGIAMTRPVPWFLVAGNMWGPSLSDWVRLVINLTRGRPELWSAALSVMSWSS